MSDKPITRNRTMLIWTLLRCDALGLERAARAKLKAAIRCRGQRSCGTAEGELRAARGVYSPSGVGGKRRGGICHGSALDFQAPTQQVFRSFANKNTSRPLPEQKETAAQCAAEAPRRHRRRCHRPHRRCCSYLADIRQGLGLKRMWRSGPRSSACGLRGAPPFKSPLQR